MIRRVIFEDWQALITIAAFILIFSAFIFLSVQALRMRKRDRDHLANLPLEDESPRSSRHE
jgi:heme/copper-type cytochrome/quinol oxidase subunit 1